MLRIFAAILGLLLLGLQITWWFGKGGVRDQQVLEAQIAAQEAELAALRSRNGKLAAEVVDLKEGLEAIEEIARSEMGMIKQDEIFYRVREPSPEPSPAVNDVDAAASAPVSR